MSSIFPAPTSILSHPSDCLDHLSPLGLRTVVVQTAIGYIAPESLLTNSLAQLLSPLPSVGYTDCPPWTASALARRLLSNMPFYFHPHLIQYELDIYLESLCLFSNPCMTDVFMTCMLLYLYNLLKDYIKWVEKEGRLLFYVATLERAKKNDSFLKTELGVGKSICKRV